MEMQITDAINYVRCWLQLIQFITTWAYVSDMKTNMEGWYSNDAGDGQTECELLSFQYIIHQQLVILWWPPLLLVFQSSIKCNIFNMIDSADDTALVLGESFNSSKHEEHEYVLVKTIFTDCKKLGMLNNNL